MNISAFIWNIADDVLRGPYARTKYRDIILPMTVVRRLDAVLEPTKAAVLAKKVELDAAGVPEAAQGMALDRAAGQAFHNRSPFTLNQLRARSNPETQRADFEAYLDGFSENVREVIARFKLREELSKLVEANRLHALLDKFCDERINLSPYPVLDERGRVKLPALDNHTIGTIFEELIRKFNEEYNEGAGEQFTPRDIVELMAGLTRNAGSIQNPLDPSAQATSRFGDLEPDRLENGYHVVRRDGADLHLAKHFRVSLERRAPLLAVLGIAEAVFDLVDKLIRERPESHRALKCLPPAWSRRCDRCGRRLLRPRFNPLSDRVAPLGKRRFRLGRQLARLGKRHLIGNAKSHFPPPTVADQDYDPGPRSTARDAKIEAIPVRVLARPVDRGDLLDHQLVANATGHHTLHERNWGCRAWIASPNISPNRGGGLERSAADQSERQKYFKPLILQPNIDELEIATVRCKSG